MQLRISKHATDVLAGLARVADVQRVTHRLQPLYVGRVQLPELLPPDHPRVEPTQVIEVTARAGHVTGLAVVILRRRPEKHCFALDSSPTGALVRLPLPPPHLTAAATIALRALCWQVLN
jgi:hypothetical protein